MVLLTGSSVQAAIGAKLCFLGMPRLQCSLWGSAGFLPTCQAGLGSILAWCRLPGKVGSAVLAALHMAQHGRTQAGTLVAAELHFPGGILSTSIPNSSGSCQ